MKKENFSYKKIQQSSPANKKKQNRLIFTLLFLGLIALCIYFFIGYYQAKKKIVYLSNPEAQQEMKQKEVEELLIKVSELIVLPTDEKPMVATIQDVESLSKDQPFFLKAQNGDKVLLYKDRAIIYNPTENILVNVGPVYTTGE